MRFDKVSPMVSRANTIKKKSRKKGGIGFFGYFFIGVCIAAVWSTAARWEEVKTREKVSQLETSVQVLEQMLADCIEFKGFNQESCVKEYKL